MDMILELMPLTVFALALCIAGVAGVVKGIVGFAMPMILISGLSTVISPDLALAGLIIPTVFTNVFQALRQGPAAAWHSIYKFKAFLLAGFVTLIAAAQLVRVLPLPSMLIVIGIPVVLFGVMQLVGVTFKARKAPGVGLEIASGAFAGTIGGVSGIWGPPTVAYLTAIGTAKADQLRTQGVIYGLGAIALFGAHVGSGVLNSATVWFSAALVPPAMIEFWIGGKISDMFDQVTFRKVTLVVLVIGGLNLIRRGLIG